MFIYFSFDRGHHQCMRRPRMEEQRVLCRSSTGFYSLSMLINMNIDTKYVPSPDYVTCILAYLAV